jgi:RimJ/RimL family protein N-acetyltransferase
MNDTVLETPRLRLRLYRREDLDDLAAIIGDADTMRFYPRPFTREESLRWIEDNLARYAQDGFGLWALEDRATGEFLGNCGSVRRIVDGVTEVELGWHVRRSRWREGIATEAAIACRDHAFGPLGLERLTSIIRPVNLPSRGVAEKIGMKVDRVFDWRGWPHLLYAMSRGEGPPEPA